LKYIISFSVLAIATIWNGRGIEIQENYVKIIAIVFSGIGFGFATKEIIKNIFRG